jgi:hypothetical protein
VYAATESVQTFSTALPEIVSVLISSEYFGPVVATQNYVIEAARNMYARLSRHVLA